MDRLSSTDSVPLDFAGFCQAVSKESRMAGVLLKTRETPNSDLTSLGLFSLGTVSKLCGDSAGET